MTREQIAALSDAELVAAVSSEIAVPFYQSGKGAIQKMPCEWSPLTDWNDTWEVIRMIQNRGMWVKIIQGSAGVVVEIMRQVDDLPMCRKTVAGVRCMVGDEKRAILEAALAAVQTKGDAP